MTDNEVKLNVKVSGKDVYKAIHAHLENSDSLRTEIELALHDLIATGKIQAVCERHLNNMLSSWATKSLVEKTLTSVVTDEVRKKIDVEVQAAVKKALTNAVFFKPE